MAKRENPNGYSFNVPGQDGRRVNAQSPSFAPADDSEGSYKRLLGDKPITLFWLLQHYSKENAAAYRAQKEARKKGKNPVAPEPPTQPQPPQPPGQGPGYYPQPGRDDPAELEKNFGETVFADPASVMPMATLDCPSYGKQIEISKPVFRIGRNSPQADLQLSDAPTVSGLHAEIVFENGKFYIRDNNSLNGVYLNGKPIQRCETAILEDNTTITLGKERLVFHYTWG